MLISVVSGWLVFFALRQIASSFYEGRKLLSSIAASGVRFSLFHISYETVNFNNFFFSYFNSQDATRRK